MNLFSFLALLTLCISLLGLVVLAIYATGATIPQAWGSLVSLFRRRQLPPIDAR